MLLFFSLLKFFCFLWLHLSSDPSCFWCVSMLPYVLIWYYSSGSWKDSRPLNAICIYLMISFFVFCLSVIQIWNWILGIMLDLTGAGFCLTIRLVYESGNGLRVRVGFEYDRSTEKKNAIWNWISPLRVQL